MNEFVSKLIQDLTNKVKHNKRSLESLAATFNITDKTEVKELSELAIVQTARNIIEHTNSTEATFNKLVELYDTQYNLSMRTSHSMLLQQYSTPAPLSYIASQYVNNYSNEALYFEPSAGNGLLTIALPPKQTYVNEIDTLRHENLLTQGYTKVTKQDATQPFVAWERKFDGIITNPPFATLNEPINVEGFKIKHLDHAMTIVALKTMKDSGKAAIIIGGHSTYDSKGRLSKGKNRIFLNYLYNHYNVEDVISINGKKLYTKQGTGFNVRLILINGRKEKPNGVAPIVKTHDNAYQLTQVVNSYAELWERVGLGEAKQTDLEMELQLEADAILILQKQLLQIGVLKNINV